MLHRSVRVSALALAAGAGMLAIQVGVAAAQPAAQEVSFSYTPCPAKLTQSGKAAPYTWDAAWKCKVQATASVAGVGTQLNGSVTATVGSWTSSTSDPCPNGTTFTPNVTFTYHDKLGSISFSAPMEVMGSQGSDGTNTYTYCLTEYNISYPYPSNLAVTGTRAYARIDELCGFELSAETDGRSTSGNQVLFSADDQYGTSNQCYPFG